MLRTATRAGDTVARVGGDEFLVLLPDANAAAAQRIAARVRRSLRRWRETEYGLAPQLSIGWASADDDGVSGATRRADQRMYALKRRRAHTKTNRPVALMPGKGRRSMDRP